MGIIASLLALALRPTDGRADSLGSCLLFSLSPSDIIICLFTVERSDRHSLRAKKNGKIKKNTEQDSIAAYIGWSCTYFPGSVLV